MARYKSRRGGKKGMGSMKSLVSKGILGIGAAVVLSSLAPQAGNNTAVRAGAGFIAGGPAGAVGAAFGGQIIGALQGVTGGLGGGSSSGGATLP